jgi:hypothetical protein
MVRLRSALIEQCIDMVAQSVIMPGHEPYQEHVPRQVLPNSPALDVLAADRAKERLAADRAKNGACIFQVVTFVEERAVVFLLHGTWAIWKRHTSYRVLDQMVREMHDENLPGVQEETQASSNYWIVSLKANRLPNYEACHDSWRDVGFDRRGNLRKGPPKRGYATTDGQRSVRSGSLSRSEHVERNGSPTKKMFGTMMKEFADRQFRRQSSNEFEPYDNPAHARDDSDGAATETTVMSRDSDEGSDDGVLSGADQEARRKAGGQATLGNPLVADEAEITGESSGPESDASSAYEGVADEDGNLVSELKILLPINHHLHEVRSVRIKRKSDYALKVAVALLKAYQSFVKHGKVPRRQVSAMVDAWSKEPVAKALTPKQQAMKAAFKEEKEMDGDYEDTAWQYFGDDNDDGRPRENIYLMNFNKRTLRHL